MQLSIVRESLLKPLQQIIGAVERRQTMPALSNVLIRSNDQGLTLTATDLEIELVATLNTELGETSDTTIPARLPSSSGKTRLYSGKRPSISLEVN